MWGASSEKGTIYSFQRPSGWEKLGACIGKRALQRVTRQEKHRGYTARIHGDTGGLYLGRVLRRWTEPTLL